MAHRPLSLCVKFKPTFVSARNRQARTRVLRYLQSIETERPNSNHTAQSEVAGDNWHSFANGTDDISNRGPSSHMDRPSTTSSPEHSSVREESEHSTAADIKNDMSTPSDDTTSTSDSDEDDREPHKIDFQVYPLDETASNSSYSSNVSAHKDRNNNQLKDSLAQWAIEYKIPQVALSGLLSLLQVNHPNLPKDARTLLQTTVSYSTKVIGGGSYHHFGLQTSITSKLNSYSGPQYMNQLSLQMNIDGLPLFKSSSGQFWPILGMIEQLPQKEPFIIGLFYGNSKPQVTEFLADFVEDMHAVQAAGGIRFKDRLLPLEISTIICDTPARAFVKCVKGHSGYHGCDKCIQEGEWDGRLLFPETDSALRTDRDFSDMTDDGHHTGTSPFHLLGLGMISQFPVDYMHLVCLGVTRKLILLWKSGPLTCRLSSREFLGMSNSLVALKSCMPREFSRKPRTLTEVDRWKATEFRQFLLYTGPVILAHALPNPMYKNFLLFSMGIHILISPSLCHAMCDLAHKLLVAFVRHFGDMYGKDKLVYNVHGLVHLANEVRLHGNLDNISAFPFENFLGQLKKMVRSPKNPLQQVIRRLSENCSITTHKNRGINGVKKRHSEGPLPVHFGACHQYKAANLPVGYVSSVEGDNCVMVNQQISLVRNLLVKNNVIYIAFQPFQQCRDFFSYPLKSSHVGIFEVAMLNDDLEVVPAQAISSKYVLLPKVSCRVNDRPGDVNEIYIAVPLLHTV